jgi:hypothetical protein
MKQEGVVASNLVLLYFPPVGCLLLVVLCWFWLSVVYFDGNCLLLVVRNGYRVLAVDCRVSLSVFVVGTCSSRVPVVECWFFFFGLDCCSLSLFLVPSSACEQH